MSTTNAIQNLPRPDTAGAPAPLPDGLATSPAGLSPEQVRERLAPYGYNELPEKEENPFLKFFTYFWGPIPWMIEVAAILSVVVQHWADFAIILTLLLMNAVVGFWEEYQAAGAIAALKARLALRARVRRRGTWSTVPARELVAGDLIRVRLGDIVPADARIHEGDPVEVDQSALTGESLPVTRKVGETLMAPIGWEWALLIWGYAVAWALVNDRIKLAAYRTFDQGHSAVLPAKGVAVATPSKLSR